MTVMVASRLFADDYLMTCLNPEFAKELKYYYKSDVQGVPFTGNPRAAWEQVNTFVEEKTDGIISDFIDRFTFFKQLQIISSYTFVAIIYSNQVFNVPAGSRPSSST